MKKYFCESLAYDLLVLVDNKNQAIGFDVSSRSEAENMDLSDIDFNDTAEGLSNYVNNSTGLFTFNEDEWDYVYEIPIYWYSVNWEGCADSGTGSFTLEEAKIKAKEMISLGYDNVFISVMDANDGFCFSVINVDDE